VGGSGGFGGGGGGGLTAGTGGALGGNGDSTGFGGGGAGLGGAFFVRDGGTLTLNNSTRAGTYSVTAGGAGGGGATAGQAQGTTLYLNGTGTTTFDVGSGTRTLAGDDAVAGTGVLGKSGAGILALTGANTNFTGGVSVTGGLISFAASNNLGSGTITLNGMGGGQHDRHLLAPGGARRRRRHVRHQP
jgi:hypothetical protein